MEVWRLGGLGGFDRKDARGRGRFAGGFDREDAKGAREVCGLTPVALRASPADRSLPPAPPALPKGIGLQEASAAKTARLSGRSTSAQPPSLRGPAADPPQVSRQVSEGWRLMQGVSAANLPRSSFGSFTSFESFTSFPSPRRAFRRGPPGPDGRRGETSKTQGCAGGLRAPPVALRASPADRSLPPSPPALSVVSPPSILRAPPCPPSCPLWSSPLAVLSAVADPQSALICAICGFLSPSIRSWRATPAPLCALCARCDCPFPRGGRQVL